MICSAAASIELKKQKINELNVFPVPDGDTGTNMSMTLGAAAAELRRKPDVTLTKAADVAASALLRGARGNSGVILSLLFRGFSKALKGMEQADGRDFAAALTTGVEAAYKAVMKPAEGTILTVSRLTADAARDLAAEDRSIESVLAAAIPVAKAALDNTVNQNPVLKKAGVVDAGGMGFVVILEGMLSSLQGNDIVADESAAVNEQADFAEFDSEDITFAFDTVFIVRKSAPGVSLEPLRLYLDSIGDSLVIVEDDEAFKVHVHTNIPGDALSEAQKYGTLELAKIENMRMQHDDLAAGRKARSTDDLEAIEQELESAPAPQPPQPEKRYGVVAVCAGEGLASVFTDLGADRIIDLGLVIKELNAEYHEDSGDQSDKEASDRRYAITRSSDGNQSCKGCVECHGDIWFTITYPCKNHRRACRHSCRQVGVHKYETGGNRSCLVHSYSRAAVKTEPCKPENKHTERACSHIMTRDCSCVSVFVVLTDARSEHCRTETGNDAADHVYAGASCKIVETELSEPASAPDPVTADRINK